MGAGKKMKRMPEQLIELKELNVWTEARKLRVHQFYSADCSYTANGQINDFFFLIS